MTAEFQLTRPRGTRRYNTINWRIILDVSTHASARDATDKSYKLKWIIVVSTHASARDATLAGAWCCLAGHVSTHASARDATASLLMNLRTAGFQLTRPRGTRLAVFLGGAHALAFQLTRPRGTRPDFDNDKYLTSGFNSRVREGRDARSGLKNTAFQVSTHASARDATR